MQRALVATHPSTQRRLGAAFDVDDPWTLAGLEQPPGGPHVRAAAALAHRQMPTRLETRLGRPLVAIVLEPSIAQCHHQFVENTTSGAEWRPLELAVAHAHALDLATSDLLDAQPEIDGYFPQFAYLSLPDHQRWLPRWHEQFGDRLQVVVDIDRSKTVSKLEAHFGQTVMPDHQRHLSDQNPSAVPTGEAWDWVRGFFNA